MTDEVAKHFNNGKCGVDQLDPEFIINMGWVMTMGEAKYGRDNWRAGGSYKNFLGSVLRHVLAFAEGEDTDDESGLPHLAHAAINMMFLDYWRRVERGTDDRRI